MIKGFKKFCEECQKFKKIQPLNASGSTYGPAYPTTPSGVAKSYDPGSYSSDPFRNNPNSGPIKTAF